VRAELFHGADEFLFLSRALHPSFNFFQNPLRHPLFGKYGKPGTKVTLYFFSAAVGVSGNSLLVFGK